MTQGILERIESKLDLLLSRSTSIDFSEEITGDVESTNNKDLSDGTTEIDNASTPWDERIHTSNKGKTQKGIWKRKPGLDNNFFNEVMEEIYIPTEDETSCSVKSAEDSVAQPDKKTPPSKPTKKTPPSKPAKSDDQKFKGQALKNISVITEKYGASFESVAVNLLSGHGVDTFDSLPKELHSDVYDDTVNWLKKLESIQNEVDVLATVSAGSEHINDINEGVEAYISEAGGEGPNLGSVPVEALDALLTEMTEFADGWEEFFKED